jgi:hypothetical protein
LKASYVDFSGRATNIACRHFALRTSGGHAAAAPPISPINSRRLITTPTPGTATVTVLVAIRKRQSQLVAGPLRCPLRVKTGSGHARTACPFYPQEQTSSGRPGMSEKCQKRKWPGFSGMSGLPPGADIVRSPRHVRKVPKGDMRAICSSLCRPRRRCCCRSKARS